MEFVQSCLWVLVISVLLKPVEMHLVIQQRPARFSFLEIFFSFSLFVFDLEPFQFHFHFSKKSKGILFFTFHFSKKSESYPYFTLFSREKRVKSGAGYYLTSIFVPNCISKNCQISSKHQPQNIGQISISKS